MSRAVVHVHTSTEPVSHAPCANSRCWQISSEFRKCTKLKAWREDLLQLKNSICAFTVIKHLQWL